MSFQLQNISLLVALICDESLRNPQIPFDESAFISLRKMVTQENVDQLTELIKDAFTALTPREENVMQLRWGFHNNFTTKGEIYRDIGKVFQRSAGRMRQNEQKALRKLRHPSRSKKIREFLGIGEKDNEKDS